MSASLDVGAEAPDFTLPDEEGKSITLSEALKDHDYAIIYFYPADFTPGCTKEACTFRDASQQFADMHAILFGISQDSVETHARFRAEYKLPFTLLSDSKNEVRKLYSVAGNLFGLIPGRKTFLIDKQRKILFTYDSALFMASHVNKSLEAMIQHKNAKGGQVQKSTS